jgi:hypothetical protein
VVVEVEASDGSTLFQLHQVKAIRLLLDLVVAETPITMLGLTLLMVEPHTLLVLEQLLVWVEQEAKKDLVELVVAS